MHLLLFDIDGTLVYSHGAGRRALLATCGAVLGASVETDGIQMAGMTDSLIARELLGACGYSHAEVETLLPYLWRHYPGRLARELAEPSNGRRAEPCPGARELLTCLRRRDDVVLALLTGNIEAAAWLKLSAVGLHCFFRFGAFGNDAVERAGLPAVAIERAEIETGHRFAGPDVVIIGDTPADIACGRHLGVRTVAVATGPFGEEELREADAVLPSFADTRRATAAILGDANR